MQLQHIELNQLKPASVNVRKKGGKDVADLLPSIRALGLLQPLLVRPNCEGFEIVAGQRRFHALSKLSEEIDAVAPVPCIVMEAGDDAKAIEASLVENIARLPMDEIDQYKAFSSLTAKGKSIEEIASHFGITERLVKQRLAIANLYGPILTAYRKQEVNADTVRILTMASKRQQKEWWKKFTDEEDFAPIGRSLKQWLCGGANIPVGNALFDMADYTGSIVSDLFGEERYFDDAQSFWDLQNTALAKAKERYLAKGWSEVVILDVGDYWRSWEYQKTAKSKGGRVYIQLTHDGEAVFHEGYLTEKEARRQEKDEKAGEVSKPARPELTKAMQNYLDLHRHAAVRSELLGHSGIALRLAVAQIVAGSELWAVQAEPQRANTKAIKASLAANKAQAVFDEGRKAIRELLGLADEEGSTLVPEKRDFGSVTDAASLFARLLQLDEEAVMRVLTFVVAETLPCGHPLVEALGQRLEVDMQTCWQPDEAFFDLLRDKPAINVMLKEVAGKHTADAHVSSTAKVQKKIIRDHLDGTRNPHREDWQPRYMAFPMKAYTEREGLAAVERWEEIRALFA